MTSKSTPINNTNCSVYGCHSKKSKDKNIHFHFFPKKGDIRVKIKNRFGVEEEVDRRKAWEKILLMGKSVTKYMRVCSKHFKSEDYCANGVSLLKPKLRRLAVPSMNLPKKYSPNKKRLEEANRREARLRRRQKVRKNLTTLNDMPLCKQLSEDIGGKIPVEGDVNEPKPRLYEELTEDEKVPRRDTIMVDKGFLIDEECNKHFIKIIRPHFLRNKKQFSEKEAKENVSISKARVHIERVV
ncbi:hypothetical protein NQ315_011349 [Exocentrus adspersus]|uniref:THAP-type domain-containing protein n=1 Tax=Exocentrus adspersus TaxID=1586481 RepID=A0AAV8VKE0_9CUCU|nr:hypothetical protein NQ315_011349 [Exocentrus adspersus]